MEPTYVIIAVLVSYLLGSIPTSVWVGKIFYGNDVRQCGSGNAGTTNTFRVLGAKAAIPVFIIDVLKAYAAAQLVHLFPCLPHTPNYVNLQLLFGIVAVIDGNKYRIAFDFALDADKATEIIQRFNLPIVAEAGGMGRILIECNGADEFIEQLRRLSFASIEGLERLRNKRGKWKAGGNKRNKIIFKTIEAQRWLAGLDSSVFNHPSVNTA